MQLALELAGYCFIYGPRVLAIMVQLHTRMFLVLF